VSLKAPPRAILLVVALVGGGPTICRW